MATIVLQVNQSRGNGSKDKGGTPIVSTTATVASSPGRLHYATIGGKDRTLERVGLDGSGNEIYRDQTRY